MSFVVKSESALDTEKPPKYTLVADEEVIIQNRTLRSEKPDVHYHQSPKVKVVLDETIPLAKSEATGVEVVSQLLQSFRITQVDTTASTSTHALGTGDITSEATSVEYRNPTGIETDSSSQTSPATSAYTSPVTFDC